VVFPLCTDETAAENHLTYMYILNRLVRGVLLKINKEKTNTDNETTKTTKLRLFDSVILLIPHYGSETSTLSQRKT